MDTDINRGDLVRATKGEMVMQGRAYLSGFMRLELSGWCPKVSSLTGNGYELTVIEHALAPLPTEPGSVVRLTLDGDRRRALCWLSAQDNTWDVIDPRGISHSQISDPVTWARASGYTVEAVVVLAPADGVSK